MEKDESGLVKESLAFFNSLTAGEKPSLASTRTTKDRFKCVNLLHSLTRGEARRCASAKVFSQSKSQSALELPCGLPTTEKQRACCVHLQEASHGCSEETNGKYKLHSRYNRQTVRLFHTILVTGPSKCEQKQQELACASVTSTQRRSFRRTACVLMLTPAANQ